MNILAGTLVYNGTFDRYKAEYGNMGERELKWYVPFDLEEKVYYWADDYDINNGNYASYTCPFCNGSGTYTKNNVSYVCPYCKQQKYQNSKYKISRTLHKGIIKNIILDYQVRLNPNYPTIYYIIQPIDYDTEEPLLNMHLIKLPLKLFSSNDKLRVFNSSPSCQYNLQPV